VPINLKKTLGVALLILLFLLIGFYAYERSAAVREGVVLSVSGITDGETVTDGTLHLSGIARNATMLSLDDKPVLVDQSGAFSEELLLLPGYNIITLKAEDRFGKKTQKEFRVIYTPMIEDSTPPPATPPAAGVIPSASGTPPPLSSNTNATSTGTGTIIIH